MLPSAQMILHSNWTNSFIFSMRDITKPDWMAYLHNVIGMQP
ncbi:hypothetical protein TCAL_15618 [Tigriopus californicus]|uniref:Uncharacterized protein n=1 Tax=Tigriopus californicus TaxID=6832 RepID=A0A553PAC3_TIGCA|nr:hypothetical protein TCAL_15618 [Tigriopus californicus]